MLTSFLGAQFPTFLTGRTVGIVGDKVIDAIHGDDRLLGIQRTCSKASEGHGGERKWGEDICLGYGAKPTESPLAKRVQSMDGTNDRVSPGETRPVNGWDKLSLRGRMNKITGYNGYMIPKRIHPESPRSTGVGRRFESVI